MKRILFLVLWAIAVFGTHAQAAIEIYANGHKYDSFQAYLASKKAVVAKTAPGTKPDGLSNATIHKFYVLSVEHGMVGALEDFYQNWGQPIPLTPRRITSEQLQAAIQDAVASSKDPKLLIAQSGKVRIIDISPDNAQK